MGKIYHIRLINGDEVICQLFKNTAKNVLVKDALVVDEVKNSDTGHSSIFLSKYTLNAEKTLSLKHDHIVTMTSVAPEIEDYYKNSVEYSKNYIEPNKMAEIAKVSNMLSTINKPQELIVLRTSNNAGYYSATASSNTVN